MLKVATSIALIKGYGVLRFVMEIGAKGCEVIVSGKLRAQRAKSMKFKDGYMVSFGQPLNQVCPISMYTQADGLFDELIAALTKRTQDGGTEVVEAKAGKGSATLSMTYAGAVFVDACLKGLNGVPDVIKCSFVQSKVTELPFFASRLLSPMVGSGKIFKRQQEEAYKERYFTHLDCLRISTNCKKK